VRSLDFCTDVRLYDINIDPKHLKVNLRFLGGSMDGELVTGRF